MKSSKKVWLICPTCHGSFDTIVSKFTEGVRCPYCSGKRVLVGFNDLATKTPESLQYWSDKNNTTPYEHTYGSGEKAWWKCDRNHEWESTIANFSTGARCPVCARQFSKVEQGVNDLSTIRPDLLKKWDDDHRNPDEATAGGNNKEKWRGE